MVIYIQNLQGFWLSGTSHSPPRGVMAKVKQWVVGKKTVFTLTCRKFYEFCCKNWNSTCPNMGFRSIFVSSPPPLRTNLTGNTLFVRIFWKVWATNTVATVSRFNGLIFLLVSVCFFWTNLYKIGCFKVQIKELQSTIRRRLYIEYLLTIWLGSC